MLLSWVPAPKPLPGRNVAPPSLGTPDTELAALLTLAGALWAWRGLQRLRWDPLSAEAAECRPRSFQSVPGDCGSLCEGLEHGCKAWTALWLTHVATSSRSMAQGCKVPPRTALGPEAGLCLLEGEDATQGRAVLGATSHTAPG